MLKVQYDKPSSSAGVYVNAHGFVLYAASWLSN